MPASSAVQEEMWTFYSEGEGTTFIQNISICSLRNMASHPRRPDYSATLL
jgi:hypothetical protein